MAYHRKRLVAVMAIFVALLVVFSAYVVYFYETESSFAAIEYFQTFSDSYESTYLNNTSFLTNPYHSDFHLEYLNSSYGNFTFAALPYRNSAPYVLPFKTADAYLSECIIHFILLNSTNENLQLSYSAVSLFLYTNTSGSTGPNQELLQYTGIAYYGSKQTDTAYAGGYNGMIATYFSMFGLWYGAVIYGVLTIHLYTVSSLIIHSVGMVKLVVPLYTYDG